MYVSWQLPSELVAIKSINSLIYKGEVILFIYFFMTCGMWKFLGQDLILSCNNAGSFNLLRQARDQTCASKATRTAAVGFLTHWATVETPKVILKSNYRSSKDFLIICVRIKLKYLVRLEKGLNMSSSKL